MYHRRIIVAFATVFTLGLGAGVANAGDEEPEPCKSPETAKLKSICKKGGVKAAKKSMARMGKKLKEAGESKTKCADCHPNKQYDKNTEGAMALAKKYL